MQFERLEVGQLYRPGVTHHAETTKFDFTQAGAIMELYFRHPTEKEISDIQDGAFQIGFAEVEGIIFMVFRFGSGQWMDAPYTVHLSKPFVFKDLQEDMGYGLSIYLIDAATGILKAMRLVGLSQGFSTKFRRAVERQKKQMFNKGVYFTILNAVFQKYSTEDLVKKVITWYITKR